MRLASVVLAFVLGATPLQAQVLIRPIEPDPDVLFSQGLQLANDAIQLSQFGQIEEALRRAELAAQMAPNRPEILTVLGSLELQANDFAAATTTLEAARRLEPTNADILLTLGAAYVRQGSYFAALDALRAGLVQRPDSLQGLFDLGNAHLMLRDYDAARQAYDDSLALNPEFWPSINNLGLLEYELGNLEAAAEQFAAASVIDPEAAEPYLGEATARFALGDRDRAIALAQQALTLDFTYGEIQTLRDNLWGEAIIRDVRILLAEEPVQQAFLQAKTAAEVPLPF